MSSATTQKLVPGRKPEPPMMGGVLMAKEHMVTGVTNKMGDTLTLFRVVLPDSAELGGEWWVFDAFTTAKDAMGINRMTLRFGGDMKRFAEELYAVTHRDDAAPSRQ